MTTSYHVRHTKASPPPIPRHHAISSRNDAVLGRIWSRLGCVRSTPQKHRRAAAHTPARLGKRPRPGRAPPQLPGHSPSRRARPRGPVTSGRSGAWASLAEHPDVRRQPTPPPHRAPGRCRPSRFATWERVQCLSLLERVEPCRCGTVTGHLSRGHLSKTPPRSPPPLSRCPGCVRLISPRAPRGPPAYFADGSAVLGGRVQPPQPGVRRGLRARGTGVLPRREDLCSCHPTRPAGAPRGIGWQAASAVWSGWPS